MLVIDDAFLNEVEFYLFRGEVGIVHANLAVATLVIDIVGVHDLLPLQLVGLVEMLVGVKGILIGLDVSAENLAEEVDEEVLPSAGGCHGIVECGVLLLRQVDGAVYVSPPCGIVRDVSGSGEFAYRTACGRLVHHSGIAACLRTVGGSGGGVLSRLRPCGLRLCPGIARRHAAPRHLLCGGRGLAVVRHSGTCRHRTRHGVTGRSGIFGLVLFAHRTPGGQLCRCGQHTCEEGKENDAICFHRERMNGGNS